VIKKNIKGRNNSAKWDVLPNHDVSGPQDVVAVLVSAVAVKAGRLVVEPLKKLNLFYYYNKKLLNVISFGRRETDNINRLITLTD
jgi:hypothetical protein